LGLLDERFWILKLDSARSSLPAIRSALACWHTFAVEILGYAPETTLPPRGENDIIRYIGIFRASKTAYTYVNALRWTCATLQLPVSWKTHSIDQCLLGLKKQEVRLFGGITKNQFYLTTELLVSTCRLSRDMDVDEGFRVCVLLLGRFCYEFPASSQFCVLESWTMRTACLQGSMGHCGFTMRCFI